MFVSTKSLNCLTTSLGSFSSSLCSLPNDSNSLKYFSNSASKSVNMFKYCSRTAIVGSSPCCPAKLLACYKSLYFSASRCTKPGTLLWLSRLIASYCFFTVCPISA